MDQWTSQLYVLVALVIVAAMSLLSISIPIAQVPFTVSVGDEKGRIVEKHQLLFEEIGPFIEKARNSLNPEKDYQLIRRGKLKINYPKKILRQDPPMLHGLPIGNPNKLKHLSSIHVSEDIDRKTGS